jgi:hypothetical protein
VRRTPLVPAILAIVAASGAAAARPPAASAPSPPPKPPPTVLFTVTAPSPHELWKMRVENTGEIPVRLTADARLITLDVTPPPKDGKARPTVHCALPPDMRATDDVERALVLPGKRAYAEVFDPRLYCFEARQAEALVPGAVVTARLGWSARPVSAESRKPPFEVSPLDGVEPVVLAVKELSTLPWVLPEPPTPPAADATAAVMPSRAPADPFPERLTLEITPRVDAERPFEIPVTVTVTNEGSRPTSLLFRPETVSFDVLGPGGAEHCTWPVQVSAPARDALTTLAPKAKASVTVLLTSVCSGKTFDEPGLFVFRPRLDTRDTLGEGVGGRAFIGEVIGRSTTLLRLHKGSSRARTERPRLE